MATSLTRPTCDKKPPPPRLSPLTPGTARNQTRWSWSSVTPVNHTETANQSKAYLDPSEYLILNKESQVSCFRLHQINKLFFLCVQTKTFE